ncbi:hypothetical protein TGAMA5MH_03340 [Trichoderma gamsii]|uniref:Uncharacterized protein n=1 Tax=Trichoderma gamsii TaxID=398673 RepID=A0A2K0THC4_9HYPO|nr:hypothetical protein TGAMA5MH_03340 [Trichoderma gamsii]
MARALSSSPANGFELDLVSRESLAGRVEGFPG